MTFNLTPLLLLPAVLLASQLKAQSLSEDDIVELDAITVQGEKLGRTLQETQTSVAIHGREAIAQSTDASLFDVFERTANTFAKNGSFSIRGISNNGLTYSEGSDMATVLLDGAAVDAQMLQYDGLSVWDLDHVEILRGPQSTSQGRNSMAGAVIAKTRNPTFNYSGKFRATYGEDGSSQLGLAYGGPLVKDALAFRLSATKQSSDGAFFNQTLDTSDWDHQEQLTLRGKLLFEPAKWDGFSALLSYSHSENDAPYRVYSYGPDRQALYQRIAHENTPEITDATTRLASLEINKEMANGWLLTATNSWSDFFRSASYDGDRTPEEDLVYGFDSDNKTVSQEIRLLGKGENWNALFGLYAAEETRGYATDGPFYYTIASPLDAVFGLTPPAQALLSIIQYSKTDIANTAFFFNGDYQPNKRWTLSAGLRLDQEKNERDRNQFVELLEGFPNAVALIDVPSYGIPAGTPANVVLQSLVADATAEGLGDDEFDVALPTLGATYHLQEDLSLGFTFSQGYRSGGVAFNQARAEIVPYDPEFTDNYELSLRSQWHDRKVTLNANAFYVDWTDQQVSVQLSNDTFDRQVENAGASTYYGFEAEMRQRLENGWSLFQNIGYTHTEFKDFATSVDDYTGKEFPNAPRWTLGAGVSYQAPRDWFGTASLTYYSNVHAAPENDPDMTLGDRLILNAKIGYQKESWSAYLYGKNLLDDDYLNSLWEQNATTLAAQVGDPRQIGIGVDLHF
ncbi:TonB-dependent receptor domain protein [Verrucomicrobiia bacterium DG1235]|nr:TonB-dependent receptor domain protein [Verrucomicrobiae bacterium DG1235]